MPSPLEIEIEHLSIVGTGAGSSSLLVQAMERELAALIAERGLPPHMQNMDVIEIADCRIRVPEEAHAATMGESIARQMFASWWTTDEPTPCP